MHHLVDWRRAFGNEEKAEKVCNYLHGNEGNEKLDVQGAIFLTGLICRGIASIKCICSAFRRKPLPTKTHFLKTKKFYTFLLLQTHKKCANIFLHQKQTIFWFCKLLKPCLAAAHVEILNSGSRSKVGAEIQNYPNTEMPKYRKAENQIFGLWGYIIISHFRFKGKRQGWGAEIPEKFLILGNYWQWILLAKWLLRKRLVPFFWTSTAVSHMRTIE